MGLSVLSLTEYLLFVYAVCQPSGYVVFFGENHIIYMAIFNRIPETENNLNTLLLEVYQLTE